MNGMRTRNHNIQILGNPSGKICRSSFVSPYIPCAQAQCHEWDADTHCKAPQHTSRQMQKLIFLLGMWPEFKYHLSPWNVVQLGGKHPPSALLM